MEGCDLKVNDTFMAENINLIENESTAKFQKFLFDLFEKNGILNDLRAYLRGHIIDVLKSAQTDEPPTCQKHFAQRLELSYQAMNMLIAEYLLRMDFSYTLAVFVSEIPLANMVFDYAKKLMQNRIGDFQILKFKDCDVWSILNYLGLKCDSEYVSNIIEMYKKENLPLVMCILTCSPMYQKKSSQLIQGHVSESSPSSVTSLDNLERDENMKGPSKVASDHEKCRHCASCKICQSKMGRIREKYTNKKKHIAKNIKPMQSSQINVKTLMRNIGEMEQSLIDEMFQQLKSVYEAEVDMMRRNEEKKIKRSLASHTLQLQKQREEMEESFKMREFELERNVQEKKKFLWELARSLREQHAQMSRAMHAVQLETETLTAKENSLKTQLTEAETVLKKRGEEMRTQISNELVILEGHLESMKKERDNINKERSELEEFKNSCHNNNVNKAQDMSNDDLRSHYDLLKDELTILKKYLETSKLEPKCVIERSTLTELSDVTSKFNVVLNNEQDADRNHLKSESEYKIRTPNKVVNYLKKQKNVNFRTSNIDELYHESSRDHSRSRSRSSVSSEAGNAHAKEVARDHDLVESLRDENERLRIFATQQREHIDELSSHRARLQAELTASRLRECPEATPSRPRTAPSIMPYPGYTQYRLEVAPSAQSVGWSKGAGEELSIFANAQPRILLPGDAIPFVGVLKERHGDNRRHLINQWRSLRRRVSPIGVTRLRTATSSHRDKGLIDQPASQNLSSDKSPICVVADDMPCSSINENISYPAFTRERPRTPNFEEPPQPREKSPKSVLREAKEKLKNYVRDHPAQASTTRDKSPSSVLRDAKLRLRKLEIEAEAVEKSYLDFRRRQQHKQEEDRIDNVIDLNKSSSQYRYKEITKEDKQSFKLNATSSPIKTVSINGYQTKLDTMSYIRNRISALSNAQPVPSTLANIESELKRPDEKRDYYLETPLTEFRKLYQSQRTYNSEKNLGNKGRTNNPEEIKYPTTDSHDSSIRYTEARIQIKKNELEILKDNITKMYNLQNKDDINDKLAPIDGIDEIGTLIKETKIQKSQASNPENSLENISSTNIPDEIKDATTASDDKSVEERIKFKSPKNKKDELEILKDNITKMYNLQNKNDITEKLAPIENSINEIDRLKKETTNQESQNDPAKEVSIDEIAPLEYKSEIKPELILVVESSIETKEIDISETEMEHQKISTQMTIIVSPRLNRNDDVLLTSPEKGVSPEQAARLTRNDVLNAIFHADPSKAHSSVEMELNISKEIIENTSEIEKGGEEDYPDDFSADVDNYNSPSDYETHSPISIPKNSESDHFWDTN